MGSVWRWIFCSVSTDACAGHKRRAGVPDADGVGCSQGDVSGGWDFAAGLKGARDEKEIDDGVGVPGWLVWEEVRENKIFVLEYRREKFN